MIMNDVALKRKMITAFFQKNYLNEIDDFYEAKNAFLRDINNAFAKEFSCTEFLVYAKNGSTCFIDDPKFGIVK
jgi:hypothetical protein